MHFDGHYISLDASEFKHILRGEYTLRPCPDCDGGVAYCCGSVGEQISIKEYRQREMNGDEFLYTEECMTCYSVGKIVNLGEQ